MTKHDCKVLIIDDNQVVRFTLRLSLLKLGFTIIFESSNGFEAKSVFNAEEIDLVFCDLNMPIEDGFKVLRYLSEKHFDGKIILISSEDEDVLSSSFNLAKLYNLDILCSLQKPLSYEKIQNKINYETINKIKKETSKEKHIEQLSLDAIKKHIENNELKPYYQPQIDLKTKSLKGVEVLARIVSQGKLITPDYFIPKAESNNELINYLTKDIIEKTFIEISENINLFKQITIAINISSKALENEEFPYWLKSTCDAYKLKRENIICELTETAINNDKSLIDSQMLRLRMLRFKISIDDFGTGYSSISQLHSIPFNEIKIDKIFISNCIYNNRSSAIAKQIIYLAKSMNITVVAEGVENEEVEKYLRRLGCDVGQGYFYGKPMAINETIKRIKNSNH